MAAKHASGSLDYFLQRDQGAVGLGGSLWRAKLLQIFAVKWLHGLVLGSTLSATIQGK